MTRSGPDGPSTEIAIQDPAIRPEHIDTQRGVGIYKLHDGLTWWIERVDVPKQEVSRHGLWYYIRRQCDEVDVVQVADRLRVYNT
jgi:hypothetical protein